MSNLIRKRIESVARFHRSRMTMPTIDFDFLAGRLAVATFIHLQLAPIVVEGIDCKGVGLPTKVKCGRRVA